MGYKRNAAAQSPLIEPSPVEKRSRSPEVLAVTPSWPSLDQALNFFHSQFVTASVNGSDCGWFEFVPQVVREHEASTPLNVALEAVALLSLGSRYNRRDLIIEALQLNGKALEAVNGALTMPAEATADGTFAAILLLCLFGVSHNNTDLSKYSSDHSQAHQWKPWAAHLRPHDRHVSAARFAQCCRGAQPLLENFLTPRCDADGSYAY